jgi:integrase
MNAILLYLAHYKVRKITPIICQRMLNDMVESKRYTRSSAASYRMYCNMIFSYCIKNDYLAKNPMEFVTVPKIVDDFIYSDADNQETRKYWLKSEVVEFLKIAEKELKFFDYVMFRMLLFTGIRKGELHALHWNDINFTTGELKIAKTLVNINKQDILQKPKSKASNRTIILDENTMDLLKRWKQIIREEYIVFGNRKLWDNNPPIFSKPSGKYFTLSHLNNVMNYNFYVHHPDFYKITIHQMRHTHASLLFESGASLKDVQAKLGQEEMQTTMNIYTHVTETKSKKTVDNFASFMEI